MSEHFAAPGRRGLPPRIEVFQGLDSQIDGLWQRLGGLPSPVEAGDIWRGIWFEEAHHSTAIEGNTLVLKQVELLLAEGRAARMSRTVLKFGDGPTCCYATSSVLHEGVTASV